MNSRNFDDRERLGILQDALGQTMDNIFESLRRTDDEGLLKCVVGYCFDVISDTTDDKQARLEMADVVAVMIKEMIEEQDEALTDGLNADTPN